MQIDVLSTKKRKGIVVTTHSPWKEEIKFQINEIITINKFQFKIVDISRIYQGCFSVPEFRIHILLIESVNNTYQIKIGDELKKLS